MKRVFRPRSNINLESSELQPGESSKHFFTDGGKDLSKSKFIKALGKKLGFQCELRGRPIQGVIVERLFKTINTQVLQPLQGYISKEEGGAERAEKEACFTFEDVDKILVGYFGDDYNHLSLRRTAIAEG